LYSHIEERYRERVATFSREKRHQQQKLDTKEEKEEIKKWRQMDVAAA
jgi:hypothetical protein